MKELIKNLIPESVLKAVRPVYHGAVAFFAGVYFGRPSEKLIVIGLTGTAGKSTTTAMLAHILNGSGKKCGYITTVNFFDGNTDFMNKHGLSMPGGWLLQKQLVQMLKNGCNYAIIECTSEGLAQNRHLGINFDVAVFTNLSHAHIESHGSFGNYQKAKAKLFQTINNSQLTINKRQINPDLKKMLGVNLDDPMSGYFLSFPADTKFGVSFRHIKTPSVQKVFFADFTKAGPPIEFSVQGQNFSLNMMGEFNAKNAALAAACADMLGVDLQTSSKALGEFQGVRGRMESVPNNLGLEIIVDYGCEPASFATALEAAAQLPHGKLIHVFGSTGGHRDTAKRFDFGRISAQYADYVIITNDDVYNSDPKIIAENIEAGIKSYKIRKPEYEIILDRRAGIAKALSLAQKGDIILITGKGSEQFLVLPGNKRIDWDDVSVVKKELSKLIST
jgi:UDP-N-acetylmuramoyl-L-alanyl-D-glutamate--2,6-diaminopimelate ligase